MKTEASPSLSFRVTITGYPQASDFILTVRIKQDLNKVALHMPYISDCQRSDTQFSIRK